MANPVFVVGVDGSPDSEHALRWAIHRAERTGASIKAVMSWEYPALAVLPAPLGLPLPPEDLMDEATARALGEFVGPIRSGTDVPIVEVARRGPGAEVLIAEATEADLLVVGTRGRGRVAGVLFGSVSRKVTAAAPCPVAVVPDITDVDADGPVVVGVDGSAGSLAALRWAGQATDGPIHAVHTLEYPFGPEYAVGGFEWDDPHEIGEKLLELSIAETLGDRPGVTSTAVNGDAREVLLDPGVDPSMIVVGARGATGATGALLGSVTTELVSHASVPVVVVHDS